MTVTSFNSDKMYTYLRGLATGAGMKQTLKAMSFARDKHSGQFRKSGDPYIIHRCSWPATPSASASGMTP